MTTSAGKPTGFLGGAHPDRSAVEARLGARLAGQLAIAAVHLPHDVEERLRVGRERAVAHARTSGDPVTVATAAGGAVAVGRGRAATLALGGSGPWTRWAGGLLPLAVLLGGLLAIGQFASQQNVQTAADIDAQLLSDNLPPSAYSDPGFAAFLRSGDGDR